MKASALQEFLRSLGGSLAAVGVEPNPLEDLRMVAHALEPFKDLDLAQLASFLKRAKDYESKGNVPAVVVPELEDATRTVHKLREAVRQFKTVGGTPAEDSEAQISQARGEVQQSLQTGLDALVSQFGVKVTVTGDENWLPTLRTVVAFRRVLEQITSPEAFQSEPVKLAIARISAEDVQVLKAAAKELNVPFPTKEKGQALTRSASVETVLAKLKGFKTKQARTTRSQQPTKVVVPEAPVEHVDAMVKALQDMIDKTKDPTAVSDSEIEAILNRVSTEFSSDQQKAIATRVSGKSGAHATTAIKYLRADLTAAKRAYESQKV